MAKTQEQLEKQYREEVQEANNEISKMDLPADWTHLGRRELKK